MWTWFGDRFGDGHPGIAYWNEPDLVAARLLDQISGTSGNDRLRGTLGGDEFDASQGGDDKIVASRGDDAISFGAAFTGADRVNGGGGFDVVTLDGDYSAGIEVQATSLTRIERLVLEGGSYVITGELNFEYLDLGTIVDGQSLAAGQSLNLAVSSLGPLRAYGGAGDDVLHAATNGSNSTLYGFDGDDTIFGGNGSNVLAGLRGADTIVMVGSGDIAAFAAGDSVAKQYDTVENFAASGGRIELAFDSDTGTTGFEYDFHLGKTADRAGDILFKYDAGRDETIVKVFTDHDKVADFVLHLTGDVHLTTADFIFG